MGRQREFDIEDAIRTAGELFALRGYHATSIADLTAAIGILRGSLYKAFPDKHSLLLTALDRYRTRQLDLLQQQLTKPGPALANLRDALLQHLQNTPRCLVARLAQESIEDRVIHERIQRHYQQLSDLIEDALFAARNEGSLASGIDLAASARFLVSVLQGIRSLGASGDAQSLDFALRLMTNQSRSTEKAAAASAT